MGSRRKSVALEPYRCKVSSWRGKGSGPKANQCRLADDWPHRVHEDEHGNRFSDDGNLILIRNRPTLSVVPTTTTTTTTKDSE